MKPITFRVRMNGEQYICEDPRQIQTIDGVDYLVVRKKDQNRHFLIRKDALEKVKENKRTI